MINLDEFLIKRSFKSYLFPLEADFDDYRI